MFLKQTRQQHTIIKAIYSQFINACWSLNFRGMNINSEANSLSSHAVSDLVALWYKCMEMKIRFPTKILEYCHHLPESYKDTNWLSWFVYITVTRQWAITNSSHMLCAVEDYHLPKKAPYGIDCSLEKCFTSSLYYRDSKKTKMWVHTRKNDIIKV